MLSRRSIFSLFSAGVAIAAGAKVVEAAPALRARDVKYDAMLDSIVVIPPRGTLLEAPECSPAAHLKAMRDPGHCHGVKPRMSIVYISTGENFVLIDSPEGQAVLKSIAAPHAGMSRW